MTELLALPARETAPTPLSAWAEALRGQGLDVVVTRESSGVSWIEADRPPLRGYAVTDGLLVEAINFELAAADPSPARRAIQAAASALGWELHEDDHDDEDEDEDDRDADG